jgi:hypothetical protein
MFVPHARLPPCIRASSLLCFFFVAHSMHVCVCVCVCVCASARAVCGCDIDLRDVCMYQWMFVCACACICMICTYALCLPAHTHTLSLSVSLHWSTKVPRENKVLDSSKDTHTHVFRDIPMNTDCLHTRTMRTCGWPNACIHMHTAMHMQARVAGRHACIRTSHTHTHA